MEMDGNDKGGNGMENLETIYETEKLEVFLTDAPKMVLNQLYFNIITISITILVLEAIASWGSTN